ADVAPAEVGDDRVTEAVQQRAAEQDRDPAGAGVHVDLVHRGTAHPGRVQHQRVVLVADPDPVQFQQVADDLHIADPRYVVQPARPVAQQGGDHGFGHQVLGPAYPDLSLQWRPSVHGQYVGRGQDTTSGGARTAVREAGSPYGHPALNRAEHSATPVTAGGGRAGPHFAAPESRRCQVPPPPNPADLGQDQSDMPDSTLDYS